MILENDIELFTLPKRSTHSNPAKHYG